MLAAKSIKTQPSYERGVTKTRVKISKSEQGGKNHFVKKLKNYLKLERQNIQCSLKYMKNWTVSCPLTYVIPEPDLKPD